MPVQIGDQVHNFSDPLGLLSDCHRRIEMFLGTLKAVAAKVVDPPGEDTARALESALDYFNRAAPKHTADEEESLFPRLRQRQDSEPNAALSALEGLEEDHRRASAWHVEVDRLATRYLANGGLSDRDARAFREAVAALVLMYEKHIDTEETLIFPLAARTLSAAERSEIAEEMALRRAQNAPGQAQGERKNGAEGGI
jgi:hemerythrin-like domain-containing protein